MNPLGPVIGPMVIAGAMMEEKDVHLLEEMKVKDSKLLPHKKREELAEKIKKVARYHIIVVYPAEIDDALNSDSLNLNWLEAIKTAEIINELKPDKVIVDCPSPNKKAYENYLRNLLNNKEIEIVAEHKADVNFKIVSAASILAKCVREDEMNEIKKRVGDHVGPGYMSNELTQKFVKENWDQYPEIFRKSWISWKNHKNAQNQKKLDEF